MEKRRPSGYGMVRKHEVGRWEGRSVVGHKYNGEPIYKYVLDKTQVELMMLYNKILLFTTNNCTNKFLQPTVELFN